jgi:predicted nucleic acid-binding protein
MTVLVDTSVWSLALRRRGSAPLAARDQRKVAALRELITEGTAALIGPIRQELLSGIRDRSDFERLRALLSHFPHIAILDSDYDLAAESFNRCRREGIAPAAIDMLIAAVAARAKVPLLTADRDFERYAGIVGFRLAE